MTYNIDFATYVNQVKGQKPPAPVRGLKGLGDTGGAADDDEPEEEGGAPEDLLPRNDISERISDTLLEKLGDKNWKVRKEGLEEVTAILSEAKFITANIGGLAEALKHRLSDSNKILVSQVLTPQSVASLSHHSRQAVFHP